MACIFHIIGPKELLQEKLFVWYALIEELPGDYSKSNYAEAVANHNLGSNCPDEEATIAWMPHKSIDSVSNQHMLVFVAYSDVVCERFASC